MKIIFSQDKNFQPEGDKTVYPEFKTQQNAVIDPAKIVQADPSPQEKKINEDESALAAMQATISTMDGMHSSESLYQSGAVDADHEDIIPIANKLFDFGIDYADAKFRQAAVLKRIAVANGDSSMATQANAVENEGMTWIQKSIPIGFAAKTYFSNNVERRKKARQVLNKLVDSYKQADEDFVRAQADYYLGAGKLSGEQANAMSMEKYKNYVKAQGYSNVMALLQSDASLSDIIKSQSGESYNRIIGLIDRLKDDDGNSSVTGYDPKRAEKVEYLKVVASMFNKHPDLMGPVYQSIQQDESVGLNLPEYSFDKK